jgi:hypothetical protein
MVEAQKKPAGNGTPEGDGERCLPNDGWHPPLVAPANGEQCLPEDAKCLVAPDPGLFSMYAD